MARRLASPSLLLLPLVVCSTLCSALATASVLVVPDDRPTIQAAIDGSPDTVLIKDGLFPERLVVLHPVTLLNYRPPDDYSSEALPVVQALAITEPHVSGNAMLVRGIRFLGPVVVDQHGASQTITFEGCRMDSGMIGHPAGGATNGVLLLNVRGCMILGGVNIEAYSANFTLNTILGGGLRVHTEGYQTMRGNYVLGPATCGIEGRNNAAQYGTVKGNTVVGTELGVRVYGQTLSNEVLDCQGNAFETVDPWTAILRDNVVRRCGGNGFDLNTLSFVSRNIVDRAGGAGIHLANAAEAQIDSNVVGNCGGDGIQSEGRIISLAHNTCYLNDGSGLSVASTSEPQALNHNIAFGNGSFGIVWGGPSSELSCNDWFANKAGPIKGSGAGGTDQQVDPLFCEVGADIVTLRADSPLLDAPGCGQIGARGLGCETSSSVSPIQTQRFSLVVEPTPSRGGVQLSWQPVLVPVTVELFDARGARAWSRGMPAGSSGALWSGTDESGHPAASGVYFARISGPGVEVSKKVVLVR